MRPAYGIPKDVITLQAGAKFCVRCDISEMYSPEVLTDPCPCDDRAETYTVQATYGNYIQDPDIDPKTGKCTSEPCLDLWIGAVSSAPATVKIEGKTIGEKRTANLACSPSQWSPHWARIKGPPILVKISKISGQDVGVIDPSSIRLNGKVPIIPRSTKFIKGKLTVRFKRSEAVRSLGSVVPGSRVFPTVQGVLEKGNVVFSAQCSVDILDLDKQKAW
jgi:hypothetical protein